MTRLEAFSDLNTLIEERISSPFDNKLDAMPIGVSIFQSIAVLADDIQDAMARVPHDRWAWSV